MNGTTHVCSQFGVCGGCSRQDQGYADQLAFKEQLVKEHMKPYSVGRFLPIESSPDIEFYRNKMEYSFGDLRDVGILTTPRDQRKGIVFNSPTENNVVHVGLHPKKSFGLVAPTPDCFLLSREAQRIMEDVSSWATDHQVPVYNRKKHSGVLRHLVIREGKNTGERLVNLVTSSSLKVLDPLLTQLAARQITTFIWTHHDGLSDVARGQSSKNMWGEGFIREHVGSMTQKITPTTFAQTNTHAFERLLSHLDENLGDHKEGELYDLYCGSGSIGLNLKSRFKSLTGIDIEKSSIESAQLNAEENGFKDVRFLLGPAEKLTDVFSTKGAHPQDVLVVDPPRNGLHVKVNQAILESHFQTVIYVSCNPASLARDLLALTSKYTIEEVKAFDFFPHTDHVETMVQLMRN